MSYAAPRARRLSVAENAGEQDRREGGAFRVRDTSSDWEYEYRGYLERRHESRWRRHCGFITYEAEIDPEEVWLCHCTDCQTLSGSAFRTVAPTRKGVFTLLSGEVKTYGKLGSSGAKRHHAFCPECGSPIYATSEDDGPKVYNLQVGTIRQRWELVPREQIWCRSALPWTTDIKTQQRFEMEPDLRL